MRLFVALELSREIRGTIAALIRQCKPLDESWKWTLAENLHVTLKFLGEIPANRLDDVVAALREVPFERALTLRFRGLGFFPNERRPRVLWAGIEATEDLPALAKSVEAALESIGVPKEDRAFTPHLTLARSKEGRISPQLRDILTKYASRDFGTAIMDDFRLIRSELKSSGAEYTTLASFPRNQKPA